MSNVIRLVNGGAIQVRTGVIQGIGPQGPQGVQGNPGIQGEQGPVGEQGVMGQILQLQSLTRIATNNPVAANTDQVIAFGSVGYDDLSAFTSSSNITLTQPGDYMLSCWLRYDVNTPKPIALWYATSGTILAATTALTDSVTPTYMDLAFPYRAVGGEVINVITRSGSSTAVSLGAMAVTRIGSGPQGAPGPVGPQGPIGPAGAKGDAGTPGTANSGFATYADMLPH